MAISYKISFLLFLLTHFSSHHIYARESQFFNKIPSNTNNNNLPVENQPKQEYTLNKPDQEPNFIPEKENGGYGLYGHESGQLPPTTTTNPTSKNTNLPFNNEPNNFLPKNYNTEAYVTESEGYNPAYETNNYRDQKQSYPATTTAVNSQFYNPNYDENSYNGKQQGVNEFKLDKKGYKSNVGNNYNYYNGANINPVEKQGMSDTRFMENGKYFYDINLEKNTNRYPFQNTRGFGEQYSKNGGYYGSGYENFNSFSNDEFENQGEQFQDEKGFP